MHAYGWRFGFCLALVVSQLAIAGAAAAPRTFQVNSTVDARDRLPGDGLCATTAQACTLRAAVQEANTHPGADTIRVPDGTFELALPTLDDRQRRHRRPRHRRRRHDHRPRRHGDRDRRRPAARRLARRPARA